jgi:sulfate adenylyltransferase (ADP) / ATP adenylyltransferase
MSKNSLSKTSLSTTSVSTTSGSATDSENSQLWLEPGTLWTKVVERTTTALASGALQQIPTQYELVEQQGISFLLRIVDHLSHKPLPPPSSLTPNTTQDSTTAPLGPARNPFLPYEPELFVADISPTHLCLLNKFNVVDHHLLLITRGFESQQSPLNTQDFAALWTCMAEQDVLAFYNGGPVAGASQPHKHLQLVPLPMIPNGSGVPIASLLPTARWTTQPGGDWATFSALPFAHLLTRLDPAWSVATAAQQLTRSYSAMLQALSNRLPEPYRAGQNSNRGELPPYNLLVTREWMFMVLRSQSEYASIPVNALGFAGALLVRDPQQRQQLLELQPLNLLQQVAVANRDANY